MKSVLIIVVTLFNVLSFSLGLFEFPKFNYDIDENTLVKLEKVNSSVIYNAIQLAEETIERQKTFEYRLARSEKTIKNGSISHAQVLDGLATTKSIQDDQIAQKILKTSIFIKKNSLYNVASVPCMNYISNIPIPQSNLRDQCIENRNDFSSYRRLLPANYQDGFYKIRTEDDGSKLPLPRDITERFFTSTVNALHQSNNTEDVTEEGFLDPKRNIALVQWAQFIEQDLSQTVVRKMSNGASIECCNEEFFNTQPRYRHLSCSPLEVPSSDHFYQNLSILCLNYVRSSLAISSKCKLGPAQQLNQATNLFDLSQLYGTTNDVQIKLRTFNKGQLKSSGNIEHMTLPKHTNNQYYCINSVLNEPCYISGDSRVNINPYVTILYTIFLRSHNNIAKKLHQINLEWTDEQLFNTTKKINIGIYQKIIYENWTKIILGENIANRINTESFSLKNERKLVNGVSNEFGTAAIRFYNSMMPGDVIIKDLRIPQNYIHYETINTNNSGDHIIKLQDVFYKPKDLSNSDMFKKITKAIINQRAMLMDSSFVDDLIMQLYRTDYFGTDILALDIMRSRDHGISGYIKYASICQNKTITVWDDLNGIIRNIDLIRLRTIYKTVESVDLIMGLISEIPVNGATLGPTSICILGEQLSNSRINDVNFYNRETEDKLHRSIKHYTASRLLCDTTKIHTIQENIFIIPSEENQLIDCENLIKFPRLNLEVWRDE